MAWQSSFIVVSGIKPQEEVTFSSLDLFLGWTSFSRGPFSRPSLVLARAVSFVHFKTSHWQSWKPVMIPSSVRKEEWLLSPVCYTVLKHFIIVLSDSCTVYSTDGAGEEKVWVLNFRFWKKNLWEVWWWVLSWWSKFSSYTYPFVVWMDFIIRFHSTAELKVIFSSSMHVPPIFSTHHRTQAFFHIAWSGPVKQQRSVWRTIW